MKRTTLPTICGIILVIAANPRLVVAAGAAEAATNVSPKRLEKIRVAPDGKSFVTASGKPYVPVGLTYFRANTGWAPQVWKQFDAAATRRDFATMKALGVNCVRVFLSYTSFCDQPGQLNADGIAKFDEFLNIAEEAGIYVHPTGPDHWEGVPEWARGDQISDEKFLQTLETSVSVPPTPAQLNESAGQIREWLDEGYEVKRLDAEGAVFQSKTGTLCLCNSLSHVVKTRSDG